MISALRPAASRALVAQPLKAIAPARRLAFAPSAASPFSTSVRALAVHKRFTAEHEWVSFDDESNVGTVGITEYAQKSLGDVVFVELPAADSEVKQGDDVGAVESVKAASDIYAPVTGVIESVNEQLSSEPGLLNKDPEGKGWLCKIRLTQPQEFESLLSAEAYQKLCEN
ncbi:uncharacterized protein PFL1_00672 [Pseudozyma flocculosa PF-1]|uniref:Glycine cleavage system H protein n=1 Tax=Pseudozyma flocculosa TaxID=84751 RepID=A0A5C3EQF8_9BASI|nr:uncharacterized protein PFL1_00672 [Pseudozyma flocculosa PF-1]EPQ32478.1 hypothetical protein PFL1_00672 [Pseudozyma flocculosa PF-1]SPO34533.1 probable Glycine cleavage system H protein, mitochondrial precursor [Pseudozyma flocculosa]